MERRLIDELLDLKQLSVWVIDEPNEGFGDFIHGTVNGVFNMNKSASFFDEKISFL